MTQASVPLAPLEHDPRAHAALLRTWSALDGARLVGGVVRDLLAGTPIADIDLGTPQPPQTVMRILGASRIHCIPTGLAHGTVTAVIDGHQFQITTLRRDESTDGRHAVVDWTSDWRLDARRRDFTINAMSCSQDGTLFDYHGGLSDLRARRVRFVGAAQARIEEDALRILRFFRFDARFGADQPDTEAVAAIAASTGLLGILSAERVWSELQRILTGPELPRTLALMLGLGVLDRVLPQGVKPERLLAAVAAGVPEDAVLRLGLLSDGEAEAVAAGLRLSGEQAERLACLQAGPGPQPGLDEASLRRLLADQPGVVLSGRSWFAQCDQETNGSAAGAWDEMRRLLERLERPVFPLAGRDLLASGLEPGPQIGALLAQAREWWLEGGCAASRDSCLGYLRATGALLSRPPAAC